MSIPGCTQFVTNRSWSRLFIRISLRFCQLLVYRVFFMPWNQLYHLYHVYHFRLETKQISHDLFFPKMDFLLTRSIVPMKQRNVYTQEFASSVQTAKLVVPFIAYPYPWLQFNFYVGWLQFDAIIWLSPGQSSFKVDDKLLNFTFE